MFLALLQLPAQSAVQGGGGISPRLKSMLHTLSRRFGATVVVTSGCRSKHHNRRAGGRRGSYHLRCMAADIRISGVLPSRIVRAARTLPGRGGVGTYCHTSVVHIDVGPRREWHHSCAKRKAKRYKKRRR